MAYTVRVSDDGHYIISTVTGDLTHDIAMRGNLEAHALGAKLGITRFLMDVTAARNVDSASTTFRFAYDEMPLAPGINRSAIVAIVASPDDHSHDFVETVLRNAGLSATLFRDRDQAVRFLLRHAGPDPADPPRR